MPPPDPPCLPSSRTGSRPPASRLDTAILWGLTLGLLAGTLLVGIEPRDAPVTRWYLVAVIATGCGAALVAGRGRQWLPSRAWARAGLQAVTGWRQRDRVAVAGAAVWAGLVLAFAVWDVLSFTLRQPGLPTLSWVFGHLSVAGWGRSLLFVAWVAWGAWAVAGWRRPA